MPSATVSRCWRIKKVIAVGTIPELLESDHPWIQEYFNGPRSRAARDSLAKADVRQRRGQDQASGGIDQTMETRANYVWVGAVTLALLALLAIFIVWLVRLSDGAQKEFDIFFEQSVGGLSRGSQVAYSGVPVGQVQQIAIWDKDPGIREGAHHGAGRCADPAGHHRFCFGQLHRRIHDQPEWRPPRGRIDHLRHHGVPRWRARDSAGTGRVWEKFWPARHCCWNVWPH